MADDGEFLLGLENGRDAPCIRLKRTTDRAPTRAHAHRAPMNKNNIWVQPLLAKAPLRILSGTVKRTLPEPERVA